MAFSNRKLFPNYNHFMPPNTPCPVFCFPSCPPGCSFVNAASPEPEPVLGHVFHLDHDDHRRHLRNHYMNLFLVCLLIVVVFSSLLLIFNVIYAHFLNARRRRRRNRMGPILNPNQGPAHDPNRDDHDHWNQDMLLDEQGRPVVVDHHIWYINTVGLQPSVINSIALCKYKSGDGVVDGTDCAICLSEFQEDETLRVLPLCKHAFHVPCIDTWLRSHTSCPMCRAPVMSNTSNSQNLRLPQSSSLGSNAHHHRDGDDDRSSGTDSRSDIEEGREDLTSKKLLRRTLSMDSALGSSVVCSPSNIHSVGIGGEEDDAIGRGGEEEGSCSSSSSSLLQKGIGSMKRSMSCTGKLLSLSYV